VCDSPLRAATIGQLSELPPNSAVRLGQEVLAAESRFQQKDSLVGLVAPDTSIERVSFEVVNGNGLEEGRLVEVTIANETVTYQVLNGLTKEEIVHSKNTFGFARASARKIGVWNEAEKRFKLAKWLPTPNTPVFLKTTQGFEPNVDVVGHFPRTNYGVSLRSVNGDNSGLHELVTHNTAILGILGVGKSFLAIKLVERLMAVGIKVIAIDLTKQYANELAPYYDADKQAASIQKLQQIGETGKYRVQQNVEDGGSRRDFANAMAGDIKSFMRADNPARLRIYNPAQFNVWRQDSRPFNSNASMASLTPAEITQIISEATLAAVAELGMTDRARVCLVYEEAHSLVPEWNSAVAEGDRSASNGSARAILQGRKYGLGCLLVTQRTANVTKTILNQCNSIFAMRTFDETGKDFLANYLGREYAESLSSLPERHSIFFGRASSCENPVLIRLNDRDAFTRVFREAHPPPTVTAPTVLEDGQPNAG
jgi:uncharacterized protein DUF87